MRLPKIIATALVLLVLLAFGRVNAELGAPGGAGLPGRMGQADGAVGLSPGRAERRVAHHRGQDPRRGQHTGRGDLTLMASPAAEPRPAQSRPVPNADASTLRGLPLPLGEGRGEGPPPAAGPPARPAPQAVRGGLTVAQFDPTEPVSVITQEVVTSRQRWSEHDLSLDDVESLALTNNPALATSAARVEVARGRAVQVGLPPNPRLNYLGGEIGNDGSHGQQGGFVTQTLVRGNKLGLNRAVAYQAVRRAEQELAAQEIRVLTDVRLRFYEALAAQQSRQLAQELARISDEAVSAAEKLYETKEVGRVDVLRARVAAQTARVTVDNTANRYRAAWRELAAVSGTPDLQPVPLVGDLAKMDVELSWSDALDRLRAQSPQLLAAQFEINRARWAVQRALAQPVSDVQVQAGVQYDDSSQSTFAGVQIGVPLPVFDRNQGGVRQARAALMEAEANLYRLDLALQRELARVFERYENAHRQVTRYSQQILPYAKESLELIGEGYLQGEFSYVALLASQQTYSETNLAYLRALLELQSSRVTIEGMLLTGSLEWNP